MQPRAIAVAGLCALAPAVAHAAPTAVELQAQGERLARSGRYSEAIDAFKAADRIEARASHACLIALAYTRRELWPQAEIFMDLCHGRATPSDPEPEWVPRAESPIEERLRQVDAVPVEISIDPAIPGVKLSISSFVGGALPLTRVTQCVRSASRASSDLGRHSMSSPPYQN